MAPQTSTQLTEAGKPTIVETEEGRYVTVLLPITGRKADDVIVRPVDARLLVLSREDETTLTSVDLPESVDPYTIEARVQEDGMLYIQAPLAC